MDKKKWLIADEVARLESEGLSYSEAMDKATEMYKEKAPRETDQDILEEHKQTFNDIIPLGQDLDNGEIFDRETGQTIKELL